MIPKHSYNLHQLKSYFFSWSLFISFPSEMLSFSTLEDEVSESKPTFAGPVISKFIITARDYNLDMKHCIKIL